MQEQECWKIIMRPGYLGKSRENTHREWDIIYGIGNWRLVWQLDDRLVDFLSACALYEDSFLRFFENNPRILEAFISTAANIYDGEPADIKSGVDYTYQESERNHIQDIAIRRVLIRMCVWFKGLELIQVRMEKGNHPLSRTLSPGRIPFHIPHLIVPPQLQGWWLPDTAEAFFQSNQLLQVRE